MGYGESHLQRQARLDRQRKAYPELETADEGIIGKVDQVRRSEGRALTSYGQAAEDAYIGIQRERMASQYEEGEDYAPNRSDYEPGPLSTAIAGGRSGGGGWDSPYDTPSLTSEYAGPPESFQRGQRQTSLRDIGRALEKPASFLGYQPAPSIEQRRQAEAEYRPGVSDADLYRAYDVAGGVIGQGVKLPGKGQFGRFTPDDVDAIVRRKKAEGMTPAEAMRDPEVQAAMGQTFGLDRDITPSRPASAADITANLKRARAAEAREIPPNASDDIFDRFTRSDDPQAPSPIPADRLKQIRENARRVLGDEQGGVRLDFGRRERTLPDGTQMSFAGMEPPKVGDSGAQNALRVLADVGNIPRTLQSSFDLSGSLRQAAFLGPRHAREWKNAMGAQLSALGSEGKALQIQREIEQAPMARYRSGTSLYQADWAGTNLAAREEQFMSSYASNLPVVKQTGRAYAVMLNKYRADVFDGIVAKWPETARTPQRLEALAKYVNAATGRGNLPETIQGFGPTLNALFFSPRFVASIPQRHLAAFTRDPLIRKEVVKDLAAFYGTGMTLLGSLYAAKEAGLLDVNIETDFNDSDWGKVQVGDTRLDIWGGHQQFARMMARAVSAGPEFGKALASGNLSELKAQDNPLAIASQFLRYKFSPNANLAMQLKTGENAIGEPAPGPQETLIRLAAPIFLQELYDAYQVGGLEAAGLSVLGGLGIGTNTFDEGVRASGLGEPFDQIRPQAWGGLKAQAPPELKGEIDQYETYYDWLDALREDYTAKATAEAAEKGIPQVAVSDAVEAQIAKHAIVKAHQKALDHFETEWIKANPRDALRAWERMEKRSFRERTWYPTNKQKNLILELTQPQAQATATATATAR